jgi:hypothetical protein
VLAVKEQQLQKGGIAVGVGHCSVADASFLRSVGNIPLLFVYQSVPARQLCASSRAAKKKSRAIKKSSLAGCSERNIPCLGSGLRVYRVDLDAKPKERLITVCSACLRASCWQGAHYCEKASNASAVQLPRSKLIALRREHASFWRS